VLYQKSNTGGRERKRNLFSLLVRRNRGAYKDMLRLQVPRNAAIRPHSHLFTASLLVT